MSPTDKDTNVWAKNLQRPPLITTAVDNVPGSMLFLQTYPINNAVVVFDGLGHPLAYFSRNSQVGISPVYGFNGTLPVDPNDTNYLSEIMAVVFKQRDLLCNWPGWIAKSFMDFDPNKNQLLQYFETLPDSIFANMDIQNSKDFLKAAISPNFDVKAVLSSVQIKALTDFLTCLINEDFYYIGP